MTCFPANPLVCDSTEAAVSLNQVPWFHVEFDARIPTLPDGLAHLDFDAWRDIRFRPDKALLGQDGGPFRMELFHLGHLYKRPVTINVLRDGIPAPVPYAANLFDYGRNKLDANLPINLGFAGFRLCSSH